jgi:D-tyrosyl-tRNA(Tyr) deacylase
VICIASDCRIANTRSGYRAGDMEPILNAMRILLQRVKRAEVRIREGSDDHPIERLSGRIDGGYLLLVGFTHADTDRELEWMADKVVGLRLFPDEEQKLNRDIGERGGALLVVSQFTLYADARKGRRPSFVDAARPEHAIPLYDRFVSLMRQRGLQVETGEFGAMMDVELVNDGPVTLWLEREAEPAG